MRKLILIFSILFCGVQSIAAQDTSAVAYVILTDTIKDNRIDESFWLILEDKTGVLTIDNVLKPPLSDKFHRKGLKADGIDTIGISTYWTKYRLKNGMKQTARISLSSRNELYDVYLIRDNEQPKHFKAGYLRKFEERDGLKSASGGNSLPGLPGAIPLKLEPGEEVLVIDRRSRKNSTNYNNSVRLFSTEKLIQEEYVDYVDGRSRYFGKIHLQESFIIGLLLLTVFLNLFFFKIISEKEYLYFALFCLFLTINRFYNIIWELSEWEYPALSKYVQYIGFAWAFIPYFLIYFFRYYLKTMSFSPRWDRALKLIGIMNVIMHAFQFVGIYFVPSAMKIANVFVALLPITIIPLLLIATLILFSFRKIRSVKYLTIGSLPMLFFYAYNGILMLIGLPIMKEFRLWEILTVCWLVFYFTIVMLLRFDLLRSQHNEQVLKNEKLAKEKEMEKNVLIEKQKAELEIQVEQRTLSLSDSIRELKATQTQLIQSEKMASLGELTAGIAHEIQNPLNFVNNFADVNTELIAELNNELDTGNVNEAKEIANDILQNEIKIRHHGNRADAIVKNMLQHSRSVKGTMEPADINALADEYLRLAYHGIRAKDKSFNAALITNFEDNIGYINIITQDIGRVLLNLYNNAFYAVSEKKKENADFNPEVLVSTKLLNGNIEITVKDNGIGIPEAAMNKIFQPFFTTKPTGQGTGLGLSLAYDIIKVHGGEIKVKSVHDEGTEFIITLPI